MLEKNFSTKSRKMVNLDLEARSWIKENNFDISLEKNILLVPSICDTFIQSVHKKYNIDFSYGGWMEDRSFLWQGGYLEKDKKFIHLGVDVNIPTSTSILTDFEAEVVKVDNDYPLDGGWGPHVILKNREKEIYILYAHLDKNIFCKEGDFLKKNQIFAKVGEAPQNGNWYSHVHIQAIASFYYDYLVKNNKWDDFDGYGFSKDIDLDKLKHPDPLQFISLDVFPQVNI